MELVPLLLPLIMQPKLHLRLWYTKVIHKRLRELDEIRKGPNVLHIGTSLMNHPKVTSLVFPTVDKCLMQQSVFKGKNVDDLKGVPVVTAFNRE